MDFKEFMKYYYDETLKTFPEKSNSRARGINLSKKNRKAGIIIGYILLMFCIFLFPLLFIIDNSLILLMFMVGLLGIILAIFLDADYNILSIIRCYYIYKKNTVYSEMLVRSWFLSGKIHLVFQQQLNIKGMKFRNMRESFFSNKFRRKYTIPFKNDNHIIFILKSNKLSVCYNNMKKIYVKNYINLNELFKDIRSDFLLNN